MRPPGHLVKPLGKTLITADQHSPDDGIGMGLPPPAPGNFDGPPHPLLIGRVSHGALPSQSTARTNGLRRISSRTLVTGP